jgi:hypothetical protein
MKIFQWKWIFTGSKTCCTIEFQMDPLYGSRLTFFAPWLPWQRPPFWICSTPPIVTTHYGGYSYKVSWSLMKGMKKKLNPPFFVSNKLLKIQKWKDFNGNGYLLGVRQMATTLDCYGGHIESKMVAKIQKSSDLGKIWF